MKSKMTRIKKVLLSAAALLPLVGYAGAGQQPNIIFILADDLGYTDLSCYGAQKIRTPNLDRLAAGGIKFTDFYATANVCTPSRTSLLTGCYPKRVGMHQGVIMPQHHWGLHPDEITIAELLRERGYATACVGKWHLGEEPETMPLRQGFDFYFGPMGGNHAVSDLYRGNEVIEKKSELDQSRLTQRYTEEAVNFIRASKDRPFFLYFAHSAIHIPLVSSAEFQGKSKSGKYGDMAEEMDWSIGCVLDELKALGLEQNTLVVFTSDNGQFWAAAPPLHGGKGSTWEAGHRVPCIARLPGRIPANTSTKEMAVLFDWPVTLAALVGTVFPADRKIDGRNLLPVLEGKTLQTPLHDSFVFYSRAGRVSAIRKGHWKLHVLAPELKHAGKLPPEALPDVIPAEPLPWLFDLAADISETNNIAAQRPEVVDELRKELEQIDATLTREARPAFRRTP
jgi:arylsulfatase A-like enzyme